MQRPWSHYAYMLKLTFSSSTTAVCWINCLFCVFVSCGCIGCYIALWRVQLVSLAELANACRSDLWYSGRVICFKLLGYDLVYMGSGLCSMLYGQLAHLPDPGLGCFLELLHVPNV